MDERQREINEHYRNGGNLCEIREAKLRFDLVWYQEQRRRDPRSLYNELCDMGAFDDPKLMWWER